ncbi:MAG TPA: hypothetical protein VNA89_11400 [Gemmatimonadaceae bacterium]|nr:hypothetical protein [Gemmatimonadaceae bacterium]
MEQLCDDLKMHTPRIVGLWDQAVDAEPWLLPREHARSDFVPDLVHALAETTLCDRPTRESVLALAATAARHAEARAHAGVDHSRVVLEYYLLRNALWAYFDEKAESEEALGAILYLDVAISMATRAALLGYYRGELETRGRWEGALERLVDETPLMWTRRQRPARPRV